MRQVGIIVQLHVQQSSLKAPPLPGERWERYVPAGLRSLSRCILDEGGVMGWGEDGERILDMHHRGHPRSKYRGENGICIAPACAAMTLLMSARRSSCALAPPSS